MAPAPDLARSTLGSRRFWKIPGEEDEKIWGKFLQVDPRIPAGLGGGGGEESLVMVNW